MTVSLIDIKQQKIKTLTDETLQSKKRKIRQIAKVLGTFEVALPAIKFARLNMFYLQKCKNKGNYEGLINLTQNCISELQWWHKSVDSVNDIYHLSPQLTIYSDACRNGWGLLVESTQLGETGWQLPSLLYKVMQQYCQRLQYILG